MVTRSPKLNYIFVVLLRICLDFRSGFKCILIHDDSPKHQGQQTAEEGYVDSRLCEKTKR